jgi:hypothetical protein
MDLLSWLICLWSWIQGSSSKWSAEKIHGEYGSLFDPIKATEEGRAVYFTGEVLVWTSC